jgi:ADP-heptose:LPS heptosyltransferase
MMRNALLFRLGGLGDLLVAFPSVHLIRKKFPSASLTLVCREEYGALFQETGVVDRVIRGDSSRLLPLFAGSVAPGKELVEWLRGFDLIVGWTHGQRKDVFGECRLIYYQPEMPESISRFFFRKTSEALGEGQSIDFSFEECAKLPLSPAQKKGKFVVVHPGSGSEKKCWPMRNFLEIVGRLGQKGVKGALITGEAEIRMEALIKKTALPPGWSWLCSPSLISLSNLLQEADLYLGNDSGITHLAAACGTEVVALFRNEFITAWRPYGRVHLLSAASLEEISIDSVWEKIQF